MSNKVNSVPPLWKVIASGELCLLAISELSVHAVLGDGTILKDSAAHQAWQVLAYAVVYPLAVQLCMLAVGLYNPKFRENFPGLFSRLALSIALGSLAFYLFCKLLVIDGLGFEGRLAVALTSLAMLTGFRCLGTKLGIFSLSRHNVLILGSGERASIVERRMRRAVDRQGFDLLGFVPVEGDATGAVDPGKILNFPLDALPEYAQRNKVREIVIACDDRRNRLPLDLLFTCKLRNTRIIEILDFFERETSQLAINLAYPSWFVYEDGFTTRKDYLIKIDQVFNILLAAMVFLVTWPFMVLTAIAIKVEDGWSAPVLYTQERVGLNGRIFRIVKFRSMGIDAESNGPVWAAQGDNRVTRVGRWIRKLRIDELPQLYNVVSGDMGFVGPRPERPEIIKNLAAQIPFYNQRHNVKPGLTGWAQLKYPYGSSVDDSVEKLTFDLFYVKNRSFLLDLVILCQTAEVIIFGKGR